MSKECCSEQPQDSSAESSGKSCCLTNNLALVYGSWLLRLWLAMRAIQTGLEKYSKPIQSAGEVVKVDGVPNAEGLSAVSASKVYALENYHGVPEGLMKKFQGEPMMLKWALPFFDKMLGPALIVLGITILVGFAYRTSLFFLGLIYISLTWGLILIKQDDGVSWLGIHIILVVMALALAQHNRLSLLKKW